MVNILFRILLFIALPLSAYSLTVDSHVHVSSHARAGEKLSIEDITVQLNSARIDRAVLLSEGYSRPGGRDNRTFTERENDFVSQLSKTNNRFIGFCAVPMAAPWALEEIDRCAKVLKLSGLKIHPNASGLDFRNESHLVRLREIFARTEELRLAIIMDSAWLDSRSTLNVFYLARQYPKAKIIFAHAFFTGFRDLFLLSQLYRLSPGTVRNIYVDISATIPIFKDHPERDLLIWHLREFGLDRVFFASDYPVFTPQETLSALEKFGFSESEITTMMGVNFEREIMGNYLLTVFPFLGKSAR